MSVVMNGRGENVSVYEWEGGRERESRSVMNGRGERENVYEWERGERKSMSVVMNGGERERACQLS